MKPAGDLMYDKGTIRVIVWACFVIILAVALTGGIGYFVTQRAVVEKLKTRDLIYIIQSIAAKIDGRLERARETSLTLARDPAIVEWIAGGEQDERIGTLAKNRMNAITQDYDYVNSFVVSAITGNYWAEGPRRIQVVSPTNPADQWFYSTLAAGKAVDLNIDYNSGRKDTFVFINALIGDVRNPAGVAGVGLSLQEIAREFQSYKIGERSNLWLADGQGKIHLADDIRQNGQYLNDYLPTETVAQILATGNAQHTPTVIEYTDARGETMDLVYQSTTAKDWKLIFQIPRSESITVLGSIKYNAALASLISLVLIIFIFYIISQRIANPFKRAVVLAQEMEKQVNQRTGELAEKNREIMDSIDYAQRLQTAVLPSREELSALFSGHFIIWRPRDIVGGDFYWMKKLDDRRSLVAVIDCTGHGVPGALMTMAANSILNHIVATQVASPAEFLDRLHEQLQETLQRNVSDVMVPDGLDIGLCYIEQGKQITFAGAKIPLYIKRGDQVHMIKGDNYGIGGRRRLNKEHGFTNHVWPLEENDVFYLTTDGFVHQNGGQKDYPFGRKKLIEVIGSLRSMPVSEQQAVILAALTGYMGTEPQRDDITLMAFSVK